jgi:hypothetical protein
VFRNGNAQVGSTSVSIRRLSIEGHSVALNALDLLGLAMSHEMGHILLRSVNHSTVGIMQARWLPNDLHDAETGSLVFTREQADSMQNEVRRRIGIQISPYTFTQSQSQPHPYTKRFGWTSAGLLLLIAGFSMYQAFTRFQSGQ